MLVDGGHQDVSGDEQEQQPGGAAVPKIAEAGRRVFGAAVTTSGGVADEGDGLISRQVFGSRPPLKTEYELTAFGRSFLPALQMLTDWSNQVINERGSFLPEPPG